MLTDSSRILFADGAQDMTEQSRSVEHDNARSEGTATAGGWLAVAMASFATKYADHRH